MARRSSSGELPAVFLAWWKIFRVDSSKPRNDLTQNESGSGLVSEESPMCFIKREIRGWTFENEVQQALDTWSMRNWAPAQFLGREAGARRLGIRVHSLGTRPFVVLSH